MLQMPPHPTASEPADPNADPNAHPNAATGDPTGIDPAAGVALSGPLYRFSVAQYEAMGTAGILGPDDRCELLEGIVVQKMTKNSPHQFAVIALTRWLSVPIVQRLSSTHYFAAECAVAMDTSKPEPDLLVLRLPIQGWPDVSTVALAIEVAHSSLARDHAKARLYGRNGIPLYIIADVTARQFIVHRDPTQDGYRSVETTAELAIAVDGAEFPTIDADVVFEPVADSPDDAPSQS